MPRRYFSAGMALLMLLAAASLLGQTNKHEARPVGLVCFLAGAVKMTDSRTGKEQPLVLYQTLRERDRIKTGPGAEVKIACFSGNFVQVLENTTAEVKASTVEARKGSVRKLARVEAMPRIAPLVRDENPNSRMAAFRVRGQTRRLIPPDQAVLSFPPLEGRTGYRLDIVDEENRPLYETRTDSCVVKVPPGILKPDTDYYWNVWVEDGTKRRYLVRWTNLVTLDEESIRIRDSFRKDYQESEDVSFLLLLADFDQRLGLCPQARTEFQEAAALLPGNRAVQDALTRFECAE